MIWPPETLEVQTQQIINECEMMEILPSTREGKQHVEIVQIAALLYVGQYVHARHTWRRWKCNNPSLLLRDWWSVGAAMSALSFGGDHNPSDLSSALWNGLEHIRVNHPAPISNYAAEVGNSFRRQILKQAPKLPPSQPYWALLNFSSTEECEKFYQDFGSLAPAPSPGYDLLLDPPTSLTKIIAFLENKSPSNENSNKASSRV